MKKIILVVISALTIFTLCGCIELVGTNSVSSIAFTELPDEAILDNVTEINAKMVIVMNGNADIYEVKIYDEGSSKEIEFFLNDEVYTFTAGVTIDVSGNRLGEDQLGSHTLIITIGNCTITHTYRVVANETDKLFAGGTGTENDPYQISNAQELNNIRYHYDKNYILVNDIDLSNIEWKPIGSYIAVPINSSNTTVTPSEDSFSGTFNGMNHTIKMTANNSTTGKDFALFSVIAGTSEQQAVIKNLNMNLNVISTVITKAGGICIGADYTRFENITINGVINVGGCAGGLVGWYSSDYGPTEFINCINNANITVTINSDYSKAYVLIGGLAGQFCNSTTVTQCTNNGNLKCVYNSTGNFTSRIGNFVGQLGCRSIHNIIFTNNTIGNNVEIVGYAVEKDSPSKYYFEGINSFNSELTCNNTPKINKLYIGFSSTAFQTTSTGKIEINSVQYYKVSDWQIK